MVTTSRLRTRLLRQAVADLYSAAGGRDSEGSDVDRLVSSEPVAREARIAITMANRGQLGSGEQS